MRTIEEIYNDLCLKGKYDEKYAWKQREGKFDSGDGESKYKGGSLNVCEYLSKEMRKNGYETYIIFTQKDYKFLHAAIAYRDKKEDKYYITDPTSDLKAFAERGLNNIYSTYISDGELERKKLLKQSENKKRDINGYIKEFGPITLNNILLDNESKYITKQEEFVLDINKAKQFDRDGFNKYKLNINGTYYDEAGYNYQGINKKGFDKEGIHYKTGKSYDERGRNKNGKFDYDRDGYNMFGFNKFQRHRNGTYFDDEGYNYRGINKKGFNRKGNHYKTDAPFNENGYKENEEYYYDEEGYDYLGFNELGRDREGYNKKGFDENKIHRNGTKFDEKGRDIEGYNEEGYNEQGIDREGYNQEGYNKYEVNREGINKKTGEKDSRVLLVEDFINSDTSRQNFCKQRNINLEEFNILLKEIFNIYPRIGVTKGEITKIAKKSSAIYLAKREKIAKDLINGELSFEEYCKDNEGVKFEDLLQELKGTDKEIKLYKIFGESFATKKLDMMDYIKIFEKGKYDSGTYKRTMQKFVDFERECLKHKELLEVYKKLKGEERRLGKYKAPFNKSEIQKIGYVNKETGSTEFIEITDEHIEYAKQYLIANGKYVCSSNMQEVFILFAKKELSFEDIENLKTKPEHTSQEIAEGITLRYGEIEDILNETLAEQNKEQEKIGQTQGDN